MVEQSRRPLQGLQPDLSLATDADLTAFAAVIFGPVRASVVCCMTLAFGVWRTPPTVTSNENVVKGGLRVGDNVRVLDGVHDDVVSVFGPH